jgi:hypothetical protein
MADSAFALRATTDKSAPIRPTKLLHSDDEPETRNYFTASSSLFVRRQDRLMLLFLATHPDRRFERNTFGFACAKK